MKLDLGSFAFGSSVSTGGNTPSWGTSLGQKKPELKFTYPGYDNIIIGMLYKSIPLHKVYIPLGKGGHVCNSLEDEGIQLAALFDKVYINEVKIDAPFIMLIYQDGSDSWAGRRTLKYNIKIEYRIDNNSIIYNSDFITAARNALHLEENACWVISDIYVVNQDELHFIAGIVNPNNSEEYPSPELRKTAFLDAIKTAYDEHSNFLKKLSSDNINIVNEDGLLVPSSNLPCQIIYYGAPGTGKSHIVKQKTQGESVVRTTFHPDSDYSTFVGAYKPTTEKVAIRDVTGKVIIENGLPVKENRIEYKFVEQAFLKAYIKAWKFYAEIEENAEPKKQYLIIEEINRGNCAQIFGDLFQLLDRNDYGFSDYYIHADKDIQKHLSEALNNLVIEESYKKKINSMYHEDVVEKVLSGEILLLPNNFYIWATMNTSDQSLFPIDSAFKRRWNWKYRPIVRVEMKKAMN
ncbi:MAG: AAA family ATPase [Bacteroidales bacterium]|nr:AAA family ATPase [Bacteroidales bacterium]